MKEIINKRIKYQPQDKYLLFLYNFKIANFKITSSYGKSLIGFTGYFNKWNPLSWIYILVKSVAKGLKEFHKNFKWEWEKILNMHWNTAFVEVGSKNER